MKLIRVKNKIISLENVNSVTFEDHGTGAKSNPYHFNIIITYMNNSESYLHFGQNEKEREKIFEEIYEILKKEG